MKRCTSKKGKEVPGAPWRTAGLELQLISELRHVVPLGSGMPSTKMLLRKADPGDFLGLLYMIIMAVII